MNQVRVKRQQIQLGSLCLGLLTLYLLEKLLSDSGVAYLAAALECFFFVWTLTGAQLSEALGKLLRARMTKGQFKNAARLRHCAVLSQVLVAAAAGMALAGAAGFLADRVLQMPYSRFLILLLAPVLFLRTLSAVLLGFFRGEGNELPAAVSGLLRQVMILGFGLLFGKMLARYGGKVSALLGQEAFTAMYGGMGVVLAMILSEGFVLLFLLLAYRSSAKGRKRKEAEGIQATDSFGSQLRALYGGMGLPILCGLLCQLPLWAGLFFYGQSVTDAAAAASGYGLYAGRYLVLCGVTVGILAILFTPVTLKSAELFRKEEHRLSRNVFQGGLKGVIAYSLFFSVYMSVMAPQLGAIFGGERAEQLAKMLQSGSFAVFLGVFGFLCLCMLKVIGGRVPMLICLGAADVACLVSLLLWLKAGQAGVMALVYAGQVFLGVLSLVGFGLLLRCFRRNFDLFRTLLLPAFSACLSGLLCYLLGKVLTPHLGNGATLILLLLLSFFLYWAVNLFLHMFREQELKEVPGGRLLHTLGKLLGTL